MYTLYTSQGQPCQHCVLCTFRCIYISRMGKCSFYSRVESPRVQKYEFNINYIIWQHFEVNTKSFSTYGLECICHLYGIVKKMFFLNRYTLAYINLKGKKMVKSRVKFSHFCNKKKSIR